MKKKFLILVSLLWLTGCAVTEWIVGNADSLEGAADSASGLGVSGETVALGITTIVGLAKWYEHKGNTKELIEIVQTVKSDLPPAAKDKLAEGFELIMPDKLKKIVAKVKGKV